jgi:flagellum-specific peptidoglycan hydrolase FlgJ
MPHKTHTHHKDKTKSQPPHVIHFIQSHSAEAKRIAARTGIPAEIILAQSALESDWGRTVKDNAYFGIKGKSPTGKSTTFATHEVTLSGKRISETDEFRAYANYSEAADDYTSLIKRKYPTALAYSKEPDKFAEAVAKQGYATDPQYAWKLRSIIHLHVAPMLAPAPAATHTPSKQP